MSENDTAFSRGTKWIVGTFELAGATDLASRVRPSIRRPGILADVEESEVETEQPPADGASGDENADGTRNG
jgi:hypothetical protein